MDTQYMTKAELKDAVNIHLKSASLKDMKWLFCYFSEFDEFPIITDEVIEAINTYEQE